MVAAAEGGGGGPGPGGGVEEGVGESSSPPRYAAPEPVPATFGGSGGGGPRDICLEVFDRIVADGHVEEAAASVPEFRAQLEAHFDRLPASYQLDVNVDKADHVLIHQKVLAEAKDPNKRPAFYVCYLRPEEINVDATTNSDALEEGAAVGDALSTRKKT